MARFHLSLVLMPMLMVVVVASVSVLPSNGLPKSSPRAVAGLDIVLEDYFDEISEVAFQGLSYNDKNALEAMLVVMLSVPPGTERRQPTAKIKALARAMLAAVRAKSKHHNMTAAWKETEEAFHRHEPGTRVSRGENDAASEIKLVLTSAFLSPFWSRLRRNGSLGSLFMVLGTGGELFLKRVGLEDVASAGNILELLWITHRIFTDVIEYVEEECYFPTFWPFSCFIPEHCIKLANQEKLNAIQSKWYCWFTTA